MFRIDLLQNQYLILAIIGGLALLLLVVLMYPPLWRQRDKSTEETVKEADQAQSGVQWLRSFMPWYLLILYIAMAVWAVGYVIKMSRHPPTW